MPGVKAVRRLGHLADVDVRGQLLVDLAAQEFGREGGVDVEMRDLGDRVDAGVRASRTIQLEVARGPWRRPTARSISPGPCAR